MKFEYKFERVDVLRNPQAYQEKIAEHAGEGWRLTQVFVETPAAMPSEYVLILERPTDTV